MKYLSPSTVWSPYGAAVLTVAAVALHVVAPLPHMVFVGRFALLLFTAVAVTRMRNHRRQWSLMVLAIAFGLLGGMLIGMFGETSVAGKVGMVVSILAIVTTLIAVRSVALAQGRPRDPSATLDISLVVVSLAMVQWFLAVGVGGDFLSRARQDSAQLALLIVPVAGLFVCGAVATLFRFRPSLRRVEPLVAVAFVLLVGADTWRGILLMRGEDLSPSVLGIMRLAGYGCAAAAAAHPGADRLRITQASNPVMTWARTIVLSFFTMLPLGLASYTIYKELVFPSLVLVAGTFVTFCMGVVRLSFVTKELSRSRRMLVDQANFCGLTGASRRAPFIEAVHAELHANALEGDDVQPVLMWVDLDDFKQINDRYGHSAGDQVLQAVAMRLDGVLAESSCVDRGRSAIGRLGGDEFAILVTPAVPGALTSEVIGVLSERLLAEVARPVVVGPGSCITVGATIGVARATPGQDVSGLLRTADLAMYEVKHRAKGGWALTG